MEKRSDRFATLFMPEVTSAVLRRVDALTPASERQWGRMSVHQMICHLSDGYRTALGDRTVPYQGAFFQRTVIKFVGLHTSAAWPRGLKTVPQSDQEAGGTQPVDFARDHAQLKQFIVRVAADEANMAGRSHPFFGPLSSIEWGRWAYRHADHHLRQFGV